MKIFAKRTKKKAGPAISAADKAVLDLLKKDPSKLNAKERRQIKRYEERHPEEETKKEEDATNDDDADMEKDDDDEEDEEGNDDAEEEVDDDDDEEEADDEDDEEEAVDDAEPAQKDDVQSQPQEINKESPGTSSEPIEGETEDIDEDEVRKLLDKLNSKFKRKLTRQLERDGKEALKPVRDEALKLIAEITKTQEVAVAQEKSNVQKAAQEASKKRKRDVLSALPPEERARREDQRKAQQEAAERRANGDVPPSKFKHALNSERRRANRRKPKWLKKAVENPNDHDVSGFHMRNLAKKS